MHIRIALYMGFVALLMSNAPLRGLADDSCHQDCCQGCMVCKLVCTTKTIQAECYRCEHETICVPKPSKPCKTCRQPASQCDCRCKFVWTKWIPGCADLVCRKKLKKYVVTKEVPSFKWVVVPACQCNQDKDVTKPTPARAQLGDEFAVSDADIRQLTNRQAVPTLDADTGTLPTLNPATSKPVQIRLADALPEQPRKLK